MAATTRILEAAAEPVPSDRLSPDELAFHTFVLEQVARLAALEAEIRAITGGREMWAAYIGKKYGQGIHVEADGAIRRQPSVNGTV